MHLRKNLNFMLHNSEKQTTSLQKFAFEAESEIRVIYIGGEPWFVAADVCKTLRLKNPTASVSQLESYERSKFNLGRQGDVWIISDSGLYFLMLRCRDAVNKGTLPYRFRVWVTSEVLPAIRKTGRYAIPSQQHRIEELERQLRWENTMRRMFEAQCSSDASMLLAAKYVLKSEHNFANRYIDLLSTLKS